MCTKLNSSFELESVSISKHVPPQEHVATLCNSFLLSDDGDKTDKRKWACRWTGWLQKSWGTVLDRNNKCSGTAQTDVYLILNRKDICISINNPSCIVRNAQLCYETETARARERERERDRQTGRQADRDRQTNRQTDIGRETVTDRQRERETDRLDSICDRNREIQGQGHRQTETERRLAIQYHVYVWMSEGKDQLKKQTLSDRLDRLLKG